MFNNIFKTKRATISLVHATLLLFDVAYKDECDYIIFLSGDSIPLLQFNSLKPHLTQTLFTISPIWRSHYIRYNKLTKRMKNLIPANKWQKQNMFFGITRHDLKLVLHFIHKINCTNDYKYMFSPDEFFFINIMTILKLPFANYNFIYANDKKWSQAINFKEEDIDIEKIKTDGYLFLRKITKISDTTVSKILQ